MQFQDAITDKGDRVIIEVYVTPNAKERGIGYNSWRRAFGVKIDERRERGRANDAILRFFADVFDIELPCIRIIKGVTGRWKRIELKGVGKEDIIESLKRFEVG